MAKYITTKEETAWNFFCLTILSFIAFGQVYLFTGEPGFLHWKILLAETLLFIMAYTGAFFLNLRVLLPRLLFRNHFIAYVLSLLGVAVVLTSMEVLFEYLSHTYLRLSSGAYCYLGKGNIWYLEMISSIIPYHICLVSTGILLFFQRWKLSHLAIRDWDAQRVQAELERTRSQIDAASLFDTLSQTIKVLRQSPAEAIRLLRSLSRSLRVQLYESRRKKQSTSTHLSGPTFHLFSPSLNFLTSPSYRMARHGVLILVIFLLNIQNYDGHADSWIMVVWLTAVLLALIYVNLYLLAPRLLLSGRVWAYTASLIAVVTLVIGSILLLATGDWMLLLTNVIKISLFLTGISVLLLLQHWIRNEQRVAALQTATHKAELELLQNQVNPHFLFNMLNNIIVQIEDNPTEGEQTLHKLNDLLKYQFRETKQNVRLADDIRFLADYLNLEKLRRDRFEFRIEAEEELQEVELPPLLFIPFVENAVKHGNDSRQPSYVYLQFERAGGDQLRFVCVNSKPARRAQPEQTEGLGLVNIRSRLDLLYGNRYQLEMNETENKYEVKLTIRYGNDLYHS